MYHWPVWSLIFASFCAFLLYFGFILLWFYSHIPCRWYTIILNVPFAYKIVDFCFTFSFFPLILLHFAVILFVYSLQVIHHYIHNVAVAQKVFAKSPFKRRFPAEVLLIPWGLLHKVCPKGPLGNCPYSYRPLASQRSHRIHPVNKVLSPGSLYFL